MTFLGDTISKNLLALKTPFLDVQFQLSDYSPGSYILQNYSISISFSFLLKIPNTILFLLLCFSDCHLPKGDPYTLTFCLFPGLRCILLSPATIFWYYWTIRPSSFVCSIQYLLTPEGLQILNNIIITFVKVLILLPTNYLHNTLNSGSQKIQITLIA